MISQLYKDLSPRKSQLCFVVSFDIANSTSFKYHRNKDLRDKWYPLLKKFYSASQSLLAESLTEFQRRQNRDEVKFSDNGFDVWKVVGDEILFYKPLLYPNDLMLSIRSVIDTSKKLTKILAESSDSKLFVKTTAWLVGYPVINRLSLFSSNSLEDKIEDQYGAIIQDDAICTAECDGTIYDFNGPSIDIGFRLTKHATKRKFVVSVDLAFMVASIKKEAETEQDEFMFAIDDPVALKGVLNGVDYPILWIDMTKGEKSSTKLDKALARQGVPLDDLHAFCEEFIADASKAYQFICPPYIVVDGENRFNHMPQAHVDFLDKLKAAAEASKKLNSDDDEIEALSQTPSQDNLSVKRASPDDNKERLKDFATSTIEHLSTKDLP